MLSQTWVATASWIKPLLHFSHPTRLRAYGPSIFGWGIAVGTIAITILEYTPILRRDVLQNLPLVGTFWKTKLELKNRAD
jgi:Ni/Fe-hydrogenase subunit HybB-like protein